MTDSASQPSKFWLDQAAAEVTHKYPSGEIVVSSGISPSAHYHIGHFREILTAEAICWRLRLDGRKIKHIHVIDDFDPLRRRYDFLPEKFEQYVGQPLYQIPDPVGDCHKSYAEHFYADFETNAHRMGIVPTEVIRNSELYTSGKMTSAIEDVLNKIDQVKDILASVSGRQLDDDWTPLQVIDKSGQFEQGGFKSWDKKNQTINGTSYTKGRVKMNWRLEWPARWRALGVMVEPFSHQEHGAAGGSYDTGTKISKTILAHEPPIAGVQYGNIHIKGDSKKMSSSKGNLYTPAQVLEVMPAEILRYFVIKSRPEKQLDFDLRQGLYNLLEEYSKVEAADERGEATEFAEAVEFAKDLTGAAKRTIASVPFNHLVFAYQAAQGEASEVMQILKRTGFTEAVEAERDLIESEFKYVATWLEKYAHDSIKFELQQKLPKVEISADEQRFLDDLRQKLQAGKHEAQFIHDTVYSCAVQAGLKPAEAFKLLYQLFLNKTAGPKIGFFLATLEQDFVLKRLARQA